MTPVPVLPPCPEPAGSAPRRRRAPALAVAFAAMAVTSAAAAETAGDGSGGRVTIEINRLDASGSDCRVTLVERNGLAVAVETLKLDLVVFDRQEIVAKRVGVDAGPLKAGRTTVKSFDLKDLGCDSLGRVLVNDVLACTAGDLKADACLDAVEPRSRAAVAFDK